MDVVDGNCISSNGQDSPDDAPLTLKGSLINPVSPVARDATHYNLNHGKRGLAIIFNHEKFDNPKLETRYGTNVDCENLNNALQLLGFDVTTYYDYKKAQVEDVIFKASQLDHSDCDCFLLAVLSHGKQDYIHSKDDLYKTDDLWSKFTADVCPTLAGKPKLFFIQACQGKRLDEGVTLTQTDSHSKSPFKIPIHADFLIAYSTIPGFGSWRDTAKGSWFIQALSAELKENGFNYDLLTLLTSVNRRVALDFQSWVKENDSKNGHKQIPCVTFMLTRTLQFVRKSN